MSRSDYGMGWPRTNVGIHVIIPCHEAASVDEDDDRPAGTSGLVCLYWSIDIKTIPRIRPVFDGRLGLDLAAVLALELGLDGSIELCQCRRHLIVPGVAVVGQGLSYGLHFD